MSTRRLLLTALFLLSGCSDVVGYCDAEKPCEDPLKVCLLPEHACEDAVAWGEFSGVQQIPPTASGVTGTIKLAYHDDRARLGYNLLLAPGTPPLREVQIHTGPRGRAGPPAMDLAAGATIGTLLLSEDQTLALLAGNMYADLHSDAFPGGEARAQIDPLDAPATAEPATLRAVASGRQESAPNLSKGQVSAELVVDERAAQVRFDLTFTGVAGPVTGLHVHQGRFGTDGGHIVDLPVPLAGMDRVTGTVGADKVYPGFARLYPILLKSGLAYLNLHTADYPGGQLRGQFLFPTDAGFIARPFAAVLSGREQVPAVSTVASGTARFVLSPDQAQLSYFLSHTAMEPTGVGIYRGAVGMSGTLLISLDKDRAQGAVAVTPMGGVNSLSSTELLAGGLYVSIQTKANPAGELRGQLIP